MSLRIGTTLLERRYKRVSDLGIDRSKSIRALLVAVCLSTILVATLLILRVAPFQHDDYDWQSFARHNAVDREKDWWKVRLVDDYFVVGDVGNGVITILNGSTVLSPQTTGDCKLFNIKSRIAMIDNKQFIIEHNICGKVMLALVRVFDHSVSVQEFDNYKSMSGSSSLEVDKVPAYRYYSATAGRP